MSITAGALDDAGGDMSMAPPGGGGLSEADQILENVTSTPFADRHADAEARRAEAEADGAQDEVTLRKWIASGVLILMGAQIVASNVFFCMYGDALRWRLSTPAISAWLGETIVQTVAVALVVMHYLFPNRDATANRP